MKRYQVVEIQKLDKVGKRIYCYYIILHDRFGRDGVFGVSYFSKSKRRLIALLRTDDIEVSKHVENGGKLRLY